MNGDAKQGEIEDVEAFANNFERYQEKQALQRMLSYVSEEAARLGYAETDSKILIAVGTLEKEYNNKLS